MAEIVGLEESFRKIPQRIPRGALYLLGGLLAVGILTFLVGIYGPQPGRAWQIYLVNFLFWLGISQSGVIFAAVYETSRAQWGHEIRRIGEGMGSFLPVVFLLFFPLICGRQWLFPWVQHPIPEKAAWLNAPSLFLRNGAGLLVLVGLSLVFLYYTLRVQVGSALERGVARGTPLYRYLARDWRGLEAEKERCHHSLRVLSPILIFVYAIVFSLIGFDLVMSLEPHWSSTLFGAYFFISSLYAGLTGIAILAIVLRRSLRLEKHITPKHFHDLGKLVFAFSMLVMYFLFTQYLVIWYGNITEETQYVILRTRTLPWAPFTWLAFLAGMLGPYIILLSRRVKQDPFGLLPIGLVIVGGLWVERYALVIPALWKGPAAPLGVSEFLISAGFASAAILSYLAFVRIFPILPWPQATPDPHSH